MLAVYVCTLGMALVFTIHALCTEAVSPAELQNSTRARPGCRCSLHYHKYVYTASYRFVDLKIGCTSRHQAIHLKLLQRPA